MIDIISSYKYLSPCIRGKRQLGLTMLNAKGSIPVHTGETDWQVIPGGYSEVYPRAYGGNCPVDNKPKSVKCLSPCIRGKRIPDSIARDTERSIPVHTGETPCPAPTPTAPEVYPRAYGGNINQSQERFLLPGLSPCIRGKQGQSVDCG